MLTEAFEPGASRRGGSLAGGDRGRGGAGAGPGRAPRVPLRRRARRAPARACASASRAAVARRAVDVFQQSVGPHACSAAGASRASRDPALAHLARPARARDGILVVRLRDAGGDVRRFALRRRRGRFRPCGRRSSARRRAACCARSSLACSRAAVNRALGLSIAFAVGQEAQGRVEVRQRGRVVLRSTPGGRASRDRRTASGSAAAPACAAGACSCGSWSSATAGARSAGLAARGRPRDGLSTRRRRRGLRGCRARRGSGAGRTRRSPARRRSARRGSVTRSSSAGTRRPRSPCRRKFAYLMCGLFGEHAGLGERCTPAWSARRRDDALRGDRAADELGRHRRRVGRQRPGGRSRVTLPAKNVWMSPVMNVTSLIPRSRDVLEDLLALGRVAVPLVLVDLVPRRRRRAT